MHLYSWKFNKTKIKYIFWFLNTRTYIGQLHTSHHLMFHSLRRCTETKEVCRSRLVLRFPVHSLLLHHLPGGEIHPRNPRHRNQRHSLLLPDALHRASSNLPQVSASEQCSCTLVHSNSSEFSIDCEIFFHFLCRVAFSCLQALKQFQFEFTSKIILLLATLHVTLSMLQQILNSSLKKKKPWRRLTNEKLNDNHFKKAMGFCTGFFLSVCWVN